MAIDFTQFKATLQTKLDSVTDEKEMLLLGKAIESTIDNITLSDIQTEGTTQVTNVTDEGDTQVARVISEGDTQVTNVQNAGSDFVAKDNGTFTGTLSGAELVLSGNLTVNGTTTTLNTATLDVDDKNITVANGATDDASADGGGITVGGANATFTYAASTDTWNLNKSLVSPGLDVNGTTEVEDIKEKVTTDASTSGTLTVNANDQGVIFLTANQTANRTVNIVGDGTTTLDSYLATGQSVTIAVAATQGTTAYYFDVVQIDGSTVTPKWQGGEAPTEGNPDSIDVYSFTVIKTGASTFTVLAAQTQFA
jgi:hypothetical protein